MVLSPRTGFGGIDLSGNVQQLGNPATVAPGGNTAGGPAPYNGARMYLEDVNQNIYWDGFERRWTPEDRTIYAIQSSFNAQALVGYPAVSPYYYALLADDFNRILGTGPKHTVSTVWNAAGAGAPWVVRGAGGGMLDISSGLTTPATYAGSNSLLSSQDALIALNAAPTNTTGTVASSSTINGFTASVGPFGAGAGAGVMTVAGQTIAFTCSSTAITFQQPLATALPTGFTWTLIAPTALKFGIHFETKVMMTSTANNAFTCGLSDGTMANLAATAPISASGTTITLGANQQNVAAFFYSDALTTKTLGFQAAGSNVLSTTFGSGTIGATNQIFTTLGSSNPLSPVQWMGLKILVSLTGYATFWVNLYDGYGWQLKGTQLANPLSTSATLYPYIANYLTGTGTAKDLFVEYIWVRQY